MEHKRLLRSSAFVLASVCIPGSATAYDMLSPPTVTVPPAAPTNVAAAPVSDRAIDVTWQDNTAGESGFEVHRSTGGPGGPFVWLATTPPDAQLHTDAGLNASTRYCYKVRSFRWVGTP